MLKSGNLAFNKALGNKYWKFVPFYIMFVPVLLYYLLFHYAPMGGIIIAFKDYSFKLGILNSQWVGFDNFKEFMFSGDFWRVFNNTIAISLLRIFIGFPIPIIFALLLNEISKNNFKKIIQTVSYLPHFISWVVIAGILYSFFSTDGLVNQIIGLFGIKSVPFISDVAYYRAFFVGSAIWKEMGWSAIIYLATFSTIDMQLYEAACIDGANRWKQLFHITLPSIRSVISIMFILGLTQVLTVSFEQVLVMINPVVSDIAETIDYYIYRVGMLQSNNYSYATAVGMFKSVISALFVLIANWGAKKIDQNGGLW